MQRIGKSDTLFITYFCLQLQIKIYAGNIGDKFSRGTCISSEDESDFSFTMKKDYP